MSNSDNTITTLEVRKDQWENTRLVTASVPDQLQQDEVLLKVENFALTANNISYAATGDLLGYWGFFPAQEGWGRIPAMGWAEVVASAHPDIEVGESVWGFFPFSTHLKILAGNTNAEGFSDISAHRAEYAPVYARFDRASANPVYDPVLKDRDSLLRGLFMTSWLAEDAIDVNNGYGAGNCLITSASSKTSIALAYCVKQRANMKSIGITSAGNIPFCESLGYYDEVVSYDEVASLSPAEPAVVVDMAGSAAVLSAIHHHYGENLKYSCRIGATHYEEVGDMGDLPGATPEFFFAPGHIQSRSAEIGAAKLMASLGSAFVGFRADSERWMKVEYNKGQDAAQTIYQAVLAGKADPSIGQIVSLSE